jgi:tetratricopeptide (TPR) repeat protein
MTQPTRETTRRGRRFAFWSVLVIAWVVVASAVVTESLAMRGYIAILDDSGTLPSEVVPLRSTVPADYADAYTWTRLALGLSGAPVGRVRETQIDNYPDGRAVYWNSAYVELIGAAGRLRAALLHEPVERATERLRVWFNLPVFMAFVVLFSVVTAKRFGVGSGVFLSFAMLGFPWFYDGFAPSYLDHHGLLTACTMGIVLGAFLMGGGWIRRQEDFESLLPSSRDEARFGAFLSAISGAVGLWISAASVIPTIALVGLSGVLAGLWLGRESVTAGATYDASLWRFWGRAGAIGAIVAYALEYAPNHLAFRLEINNPLYALAWLGGAELVAAIVDRRINNLKTAPWRIAAATAALIAPPIIIVLARSSVFVPLDPRMERVHSQIKEFFSLGRLIKETGSWVLPRFAMGLALLAPVLLVLRKGTNRILIAFLSIVAVLAVTLACWQVRWWLMASGPELCLALASILTLAPPSRSGRHWLAVGALSALFAAQAIARIGLTRSNVQNQAVAYADALQPMYRDAAIAIRKSYPEQRVVLLASPNASTAIGYFGRFQTLASLYWENLAGLEGAARIFSAPSDTEALRLLVARHVTHVVVTNLDNSLADYLELARPGSSRDGLRSTFGYRLLQGDSTPRWLRAIPFRPRFPSEDSTSVVLLFEIAPEQSLFEASWNLGLANLARGQAALAMQDFTKAISDADARKRSELFEDAATLAYRSREHALALALLDSAVASGFTVRAAANIAWILATSRNDQVRNGGEALRRGQELYRRDPADPTVLDAVAAALAENGRFAEAIIICQRMDSIATVAGDQGGQRRARDRMASYAAHRPWRQ